MYVLLPRGHGGVAPSSYDSDVQRRKPQEYSRICHVVEAKNVYVSGRHTHPRPESQDLDWYAGIYLNEWHDNTKFVAVTGRTDTHSSKLLYEVIDRRVGPSLSPRSIKNVLASCLMDYQWYGRSERELRLQRQIELIERGQAETDMLAEDDGREECEEIDWDVAESQS